MRTKPWEFEGIYKYCSIDTAIRIIETRSLLLQKPSAFNDPFEAIPNVYHAVKGLNEEWFYSTAAFDLNHYCYRLTGHMIGFEGTKLGDNLSSRPVKRINIERFTNIARTNRFPELWYRDYLRHKDAYMECIMAIIKRKTDDFRVTCFSRSYNSVLMWSHYTNCHSGCLLAFCLGDLEDKTDIVEYRNVMNEIDLNEGVTDDYLRECLCTKASCWNYEHEWRLIVPTHRCEVNNKGKTIFKFPIDELCGIALGLRCSWDDGLRIERALRENGLSSEVHMGQAFLHPFKYRMEIYGGPAAMSNGGKIIWPMQRMHKI